MISVSPLLGCCQDLCLHALLCFCLINFDSFPAFCISEKKRTHTLRKHCCTNFIVACYFWGKKCEACQTLFELDSLYPSCWVIFFSQEMLVHVCCSKRFFLLFYVLNEWQVGMKKSKLRTTKQVLRGFTLKTYMNKHDENSYWETQHLLLRWLLQAWHVTMWVLLLG